MDYLSHIPDLVHLNDCTQLGEWGAKVSGISRVHQLAMERIIGISKFLCLYTILYGLPPNCLDEAPLVDSQISLTHNNFQLARGHPCLRRFLSHTGHMSYKHFFLLLTIVVMNFALVAAPAHAGFGGSAVHSFNQGHYGWATFFLILGIAAGVLNAGKKKSDQSE